MVPDVSFGRNQPTRVGMTGYQLANGLLIESRNLSDPTHIYTAGTKKWRCAKGLNEGAGTLVMSWYKQQNGTT